MKKGVPFAITVDDIPPIPSVCPFLNIPLKSGRQKLTQNSPSLDRIDPQRGYVRGNLQILSHKANAMKNSATLEEFEAMAQRWRAEIEIANLIG